MRTSLTELLHERSVAHPTCIESAVTRDGELRLEVTGYRWWDERDAVDGRIALTFVGPFTGMLDAGLLSATWDNEALETFHVGALAEEPWALSGRVHSLYCRAPLPDPLAVHAAVHDFLVDHRAPRSAADYLNGGPTLAGLRKLAARDDYLLSRAPEALHALIAAEVMRQGVRHHVLMQDYPSTDELFVMLGDASFTCTDAWAEWDGDRPE